MRIPVVCVGVLAVVLAACGGQNETPFTEPHRTGAIPGLKRDVDESAFFVSEQDEFHSNSLFESVRKKTLTKFGYRDEEPPVKTRNENEVHQAVIDAGIAGLKIDTFRSTQFRKPEFPFDYENDIERLRRLASIHQLDTLLTDDMTELDKAIAIMDYTYRFMAGGSMPVSGDDPGPSAELITARRIDGIGGEARHYAALFCQLTLTTGLNARIIGMHGFDENGMIQSHMAVEVFMNRYRKWVLFDPFSEATYYTRDGEPQSALELRELMLDRNFRSIDVFSTAGDFTSAAYHKERLLERYRYLYLFRMNDILSKSPRNGSISWQELYQTHLVWEDGRSLVSEGQFDRNPIFTDTVNAQFPLNGVRFVTRDPEEFNWQLNYIIFDLEAQPGSIINAYINTVTPNFKDFLVNDDREYSTSRYMFRIMRIAHAVTVSATNAFDVVGPEAWVDFSW